MSTDGRKGTVTLAGLQGHGAGAQLWVQRCATPQSWNRVTRTLSLRYMRVVTPVKASVNPGLVWHVAHVIANAS